MPELNVSLGALELKNPVMPASGCFAIEYSESLDFNQLGALVLKSVSPVKRSGNPIPRVCETRGGMMNAIGIPSQGLEYYREKVIPAYSIYSTPLVVSISADTKESFASAVAEMALPSVAAIEVNISCPNLEADGMAFAMSPDTTFDVVSAIRKKSDFPLWAKLTPNAGNVVEVALAAEAAGVDAIVMGNTFLAMSIDIYTRKPRLGNVMGGLSGPAIKPISLRMVHQCYRALKIPVIGCGGISSSDDAIEFMLAGATAIQVGTASFIDPGIMQKIINGIDDYCVKYGVSHIRDIVGQVNIDEQIFSRWNRFAQ
ncbi:MULTISPECIES: dihydroorotate dehydrogenase [Xenorhabdus]|uniref:dihydroorotate dehydrogenase n=1 Tax=Xenorhabdus TaxID=626 RepID=UPI001E3F9B79|nr:dihydroorotate dehydrogenase [Xenorhabdus sp. PB30.3]MCC8378168.1 dihydroorotate dehydrogenase [Xenorhabdus sp. PB30.3]